MSNEGEKREQHHLYLAISFKELKGHHMNELINTWEFSHIVENIL